VLGWIFWVRCDTPSLISLLLLCYLSAVPTPFADRTSVPLTTASEGGRPDRVDVLDQEPSHTAHPSR
jgi:hypothetical protein